MRGTRWLLLLAMVAILGGSGYFYLLLKQKAARTTPAKPEALPPDTNSTAIDYEYGQSTGGTANFRVKARSYRQIRDTPNYELEDLELKLMLRDGKHYDLIKSAKAEFNQAEGRMYSDGAVEITLEVPLTGEPLHRLTHIQTSGVTFDSKQGKAVTDRAAKFEFENGDGKCTGASYDPTTRELHLLNSPEMHLTGKGPNGKPMTVEAGEITYKEHGGTVNLTPWSRMIRAETTIDAAASLVNLKKDGHVDNIDAQHAHGVDKFPKRELHYSADALHVGYNEDGEINKITGTGHAKMHEESAGAVTDTQSNTAELDFKPGEGQSLLQHVLAQGDAVVTSKPAPGLDGKSAETRVLKANTIEVAMRPDGKEIDQVKTHEPGTLEFLPNTPDQHRRILTGDQMTINYAANNVIKDFSSVHSSTLTYPAANNRTKAPASSKTTSTWLSATFDNKGQLATMKQWENFTYEQGERKAKATTATLDQQASVMDLETGARIWDTSGATDADRIHLMEKTGDYVADGHVMTSRLPEQDPKKQKSGEMLDGDQPVQGTAPHMTSANHNKLVHYEGGAVVWQGADRIEAQTVAIDRDKHTLSADGNVTTQFLDEEKDEDKKSGDRKEKGAPPPEHPIVKVSDEKTPRSAPQTDPNAKTSAPAYTVVTSDKLVYTDGDRLANYSGNVQLTRPGLTVKSAALRAFLNPRDSGESSRLNHAVGDGHVEIAESRADRKRLGRGDHGEYLTAEDKIILRGNLADLYDSTKQDESHGTELTYFTSDDRLLITGAPSKPVASRLYRKPKHAHPGNP